MRKLSALVLAGTLLLVPICGCAQTSSQTQVDEQTQTDGKYDDIIADLEEENYDGAIATITEMKKEALAKTHTDMEKYLVTVELTPENFDEYFEVVVSPVVDAFGETDHWVLGVRSKKYDDGLILYGLDDSDYCDSIELEFTLTYYDDNGTDKDQYKCSLDDALALDAWSFWDVDSSITFDSLDRMVGSKLTFIKRDFVESYDILPAEHPEDPEDSFYTTATITLKNGEVFDRMIARDYPY